MIIKNIKKIILDKPQKFYDITVEKYHNFSITNSNIITHNSSLEQGMVGMAQDYVGSNNINLLTPEGQFGTRLMGGKDSAASRYIFTKLNELTRLIFRPEDDPILEYLDDDGFMIEPKYYIPIIPMLLVNGTEGIGTGWSTDIPKYNPKDLIKIIENKLSDKSSKEPIPWSRDFKGETIKTDNSYITRGKITQINTSKVQITELPVNMWNDKFISILDKLIDDKVIKDYINNSSDKDIDFIIDFQRESLARMDKSKLLSTFKLDSTVSFSNMHAFNDTAIVKYNSVLDIIDDFYDKRLLMYDKRKKHQIKLLEEAFLKLTNIVRFIEAIISGKLKINNRKKDDIISDLEKMKFDTIEDSFGYLINMPIYNLTQEKVAEYNEAKEDKFKELETLRKISIKELWKRDLDELKKKLNNY
jgi:DNA topoisomerase-2